MSNIEFRVYSPHNHMTNSLSTEGKGSGDNENQQQRRGRFVEIEDETVQQDATLKTFLQGARATMSRRSDGVFISTSQKVDTSLLRKYGIPVQGALIVPAGNEDVDGEIARVRSVIDNITRSAAEEAKARKEREKADAKQIANEEFARRMQALRPHVEAYENLAREYTDSFGAHLVTEQDGEIKMIAGRFTFNVLPLTTDYELPEKVRGERQMPKPEWAAGVQYIKGVLDKEIAIAADRARLLPVVQKLVRQLEADFAESNQGVGYKKTLPKKLTFWGVDETSQEMRFGDYDDTYEWSDAGIAKLQAAIANARNEMQDADGKGWYALKQIPLNGLPVTRPDLNTNYTSLKIGERIIQFGSPKSSLIAYEWALNNGAMRIVEYRVREAVKDGKNISQIVAGHGTSPDHMRTITNYAYTLGDVRIGEPEEPLHQLATRLIRERREGERSKELQDLCVKVHVYAAKSRTKGEVIAEIEGPYAIAITNAKNRLTGCHPRRGLTVTVTRILGDGKEAKKISTKVNDGREAYQYLNSLVREQFVDQRSSGAIP